MIVQWAAGLHWSYSARGWLGLFASLSDGRVLLRHEITWLNVAPEDAAVQLIDKLAGFGLGIPRDAEKRGLAMLRYVVAQDDIFPQAKGSGETIAETFSRAGIPMRRADMDEINGWNRLRSWFRSREYSDDLVVPTHKFTSPSMVIHRDCTYFLRTVPTLISDEKNPDLIVDTTDSYPARGARYYAMSRPSPARKPPTPTPPRESVYYDVDKIRQGMRRPVLGSDNVI